MNRQLLPILVLLLLSNIISGQTKHIHVFVALCDNENQGIVPVPAILGNGKDAANNLYWGAAYGIKSYLKYKTTDWKLIKTIKPNDSLILERLVFKHTTKDAYILADAYDGEKIKTCIVDFLKAANGQNPVTIAIDSTKHTFGGNSDLVAYIGHDGLMEFSVDIKYTPHPKKRLDAIMLACYSKTFFSPEIKKSGANPLLWTTHLMAPEAYTLKAAIDGWLNKESPIQIDERAAQAYNKYQKCGIAGARNLFTTGF